MRSRELPPGSVFMVASAAQMRYNGGDCEITPPVGA